MIKIIIKKLDSGIGALSYIFKIMIHLHFTLLISKSD